MIDFVGLSGREHDRVKGFSHGMKQRLGIAQALMHDPDLILLDEPTTGLDPQGIIDMRILIQKLSREMGKTVVLSSHLLSEIELIATRMLIVHKGQSLKEGSVQELLHEQPLHMYLDARPIDRAEALLRARPELSVICVKDGQLVLQTRREDVPQWSRALLEAGLDLYSLEPHRALEDYFLQLVNT
jgi:ABC-type multidrug transport system ATPase subunit